MAKPAPEISLQEDAITMIAKLLQGCEDTLTGIRVKSLSNGTMGADNSGVVAVTETEEARQRVEDMIEYMIGLVQGLELDLRKFENDIRYADDDAATRVTNLLIKLGAV